ncbi:MAG: FAD-binding oxidoreductase [Paracoccaceae bacterium]
MGRSGFPPRPLHRPGPRGITLPWAGVNPGLPPCQPRCPSSLSAPREANHARKLKSIVGAAQVLTGPDASKYSHDFTRTYHWSPLAVVRPATTAEVAEIVKLANATAKPPWFRCPAIPASPAAPGPRARSCSLERMNAIREISPAARLAVVEAGVVLSALREAAQEHGLIFPLTFGAQGSAMIGGNLSTNAGGSNVLRYGNTRDLVLGIEAVLPTGEVVDLMSELHKDNSGYNLKHLLIGAEGTLGIITAAVLKLVPKPGAYATAMVAVPALDQALSLLNRLQSATGGAVEAFEYMPRSYIEQHLKTIDGAREPFDAPHEVNILVELGATAPRDVTPGPDGRAPISVYFEVRRASKAPDAVCQRASEMARGRSDLASRSTTTLSQGGRILTGDGCHRVDPATPGSRIWRRQRISRLRNRPRSSASEGSGYGCSAAFSPNTDRPETARARRRTRRRDAPSRRRSIR